MSRHLPIYIDSSDEEPFEDDSYVGPEPEHPRVVPRVTSDDTSVATPIVSPVDSLTHMLGSTFMATRHQAAESSRGPILRRTPRMSVRGLPPGLLAPRGKAPMVDPEMPFEEPPPERLRPIHLDWIPTALRQWRSLEGIPSTCEVGQSSHTPPSVQITGEPLELTVPTLVAVVHTVFGMLHDIQGHVRELQSDTSRLDGDVTSIYGRLGAAETQMISDHEAADHTRARVDLFERRAVRVGVAVVVSCVMAMMVTAVGFYLQYYH